MLVVTVGKLLVSESVSSSELLEVCMRVMVSPYRAVMRSKELRKGQHPGLCWTCLTFFVFLSFLFLFFFLLSDLSGRHII